MEVVINNNAVALQAIDGLLGNQVKRTSQVFAAGIPWGPRIPYFDQNQNRHNPWDMLVRIYFNIHISTPGYCWDLDGTIAYYVLFFLDTQRKLQGSVDGWGWHIDAKPYDACRSKVQDMLTSGVQNGMPTLQSLINLAIATSAPGILSEIYLLPGSGTKTDGPFNEDADTDVALVVRPFHINPKIVATVIHPEI